MLSFILLTCVGMTGTIGTFTWVLNLIGQQEKILISRLDRSSED